MRNCKNMKNTRTKTDRNLCPRTGTKIYRVNLVHSLYFRENILKK